MPASLDEARYNYEIDAPFSTTTNFYLLLGDNAYGFSSSASDLDAHFIILDIGSQYTIIAVDNTNGFDTFVDIHNRNGQFLFSSDYTTNPNFTAVTFTALDSKLFVIARSTGPGIYGIRATNDSNVESNGVGEEVFSNINYSGSLDYSSDSDHFYFSGVAGHTYQINVISNISDIFLKVTNISSSVYTPDNTVVGSSGVYTFTAATTARYDLSFSSNSFTSRGSYSFIAGDITGNTNSGGGTPSINGTEGADSLTGTAASEQILGGGGYDSISAGSGNDTVDGGSGPSYLRGDDGNDSLIGGAAFDDINGNMGDDTVSTGAGDDYSVGGKDNDLLFGDAGGDVVWGNLGNDTCNGGDGNDQVRGGQGNDIVDGGAGDDYVSGDKGSDTVTGGTGADLFHTWGEAGLDRVLDFHVAEGDRVLLDPGTTYTVGQVGADTVIDMTGGGQMTLVGIQLSALTPGWIFGA